jgi:hypothetical protein
LFHLRHSHGSAENFFIIRSVGLPRPALIPLRDGEALLPWPLKPACERNKSNAGSAMEEQKNRVVDVLAAHLDPLLNAPDSHRLQTVDAIG